MPSHADLLDRLQTALASRDRQRSNEAVDAFLKYGALGRSPWRTLATLAAQNGEVTQALRAADRLVEASQGAAAARFERAIIMARAGRLQQASHELRQLDSGIDSVSKDFTLGTIALELGDAAGARKLLTHVVDVRPGAGNAWLAVAMAGTMSQDVAGRLLAAEAAIAGSPPPEQAAYWYAAGRVHLDRGDHDAAFAAFTRGASLRRLNLRYDRAADARNATAALGCAEIVRDAKASPATAKAIFVTGLPRSGTTLVEHILSSHSRVTGGGELNLMRLLAQDAGGTSARSMSAYLAQGGSTDDLRSLYVHLLAEKVGSAGIIVDKSLNLSRFLGLAATAIPDAPIIWVRRDPLDCAWSCFRTHFAAGTAWSLDQGDMAFHFKLEDHLHQQWTKTLGERLLTVCYEELVNSPSAEVKRIIRHCGLDDEPALYSPHLAKRAVTTSSVMQVRQPINRDAIGTSLPFRPHLQRFQEVYRAPQ
jgi:hypothetical protein